MNLMNSINLKNSVLLLLKSKPQATPTQIPQIIKKQRVTTLAVFNSKINHIESMFDTVKIW